MNENQVIYYADSDENQRRDVGEMLSELGHSVPVSTDSGSELIKAVAKRVPDLTIVSMKLDDMEAIDALLECAKIEPTASIILAESGDLSKVEEALKDHVMAYMVRPIKLEDLRPTIYLVSQRFDQFQELRNENRELKDALDGRRWMEKAKGILMQKYSISEDEAYRKLHNFSITLRGAVAGVMQGQCLKETFDAQAVG